MPQSTNTKNAPSLMLIMRSVAQAASMTTADLMAGGRSETQCVARAAVYKIAAAHGYHKAEIMYFLDRNRSVAYNLEANLSGHLTHSPAFRAICTEAARILEAHPHRATIGTAAAKRTGAPLGDGAAATPPSFTAWCGTLGWKFTEEECNRIWLAERDAEEFMKTFGLGRAVTNAADIVNPTYYIHGNKTD